MRNYASILFTVRAGMTMLAGWIFLGSDGHGSVGAPNCRLHAYGRKGLFLTAAKALAGKRRCAIKATAVIIRCCHKNVNR